MLLWMFKKLLRIFGRNVKKFNTIAMVKYDDGDNDGNIDVLKLCIFQ